MQGCRKGFVESLNIKLSDASKILVVAVLTQNLTQNRKNPGGAERMRPLEFSRSPEQKGPESV